MNIADAITDVDRRIEDAQRPYREEDKRRRGEPGYDRAAAHALGREMGLACASLMRQRKALEAPIVSLVAHDGRLFLATSGGVFEVKGDSLVFIDLRFNPPAAGEIG